MLASLDKFEYKGPGWVDWLASFGASFLIALEVNSRGARDLVQSGVSYYFREPWVANIHTLSVSLNIAFIACAAVWLVSRFKKPTERAMTVIACLSLVLIWTEMALALKAVEGAVYTLPELPFRPINNLGIAGSQVFGSYLIFKLPVANLKPLSVNLLKAGLCVCLWLLQAILWQSFFVPG